MHSLDHLPEEVIDAIVDYTLQRVRIDPPLDHPSTEAELRELVGPTITEQGIGGLEALLIRVQLARPDQKVLDPATYNQIFTMHGVTMIFFVVMPLSAAFINYLLPLMIGARDVAFPRLNALSYWVFLFGGLLLTSSFFFGAPDGGWFNYAPLSTKAIAWIGLLAERGRMRASMSPTAATLRLPRASSFIAPQIDRIGREIPRAIHHPAIAAAIHV